MKYSALQLIKRILIHARAYWIHILGLFILTLLSTPLALLKPVGMKILIDSGFGSEPLPGFIRVFFPGPFSFTFTSVVIVSITLILVVAILDNLSGYISWIWSTFTGEKLVLNFRLLLFNHIQRLSLAYHDRKGASDSLYRIQWDTMCVRSFLLGQLSPLISSFITLISMIVVMLLINWSFAVIALCVIPPLFFLTRLSSKQLRKNWYSVKNAESGAMSVIHEVLSSLRVVKAFGQEENEGNRFLDRSNKAVNGQLKMAKVGAKFQFIVGMVFTSGTVLFIYFGAQYVHTGKLTLGELTLVLAYLGQIFGPLQNISKNLNEVQSSLVSIDRVFSVLDEEKEVKENPHAVPLSRVEGRFEFDKVYFSYEKERPTLQNISFEIKPGDRVGIMGSTGAGKSTLISLINRFYDPSEGVIRIDGVDIKNYKLADYRSQFSIVLQDPVLFSTTIAENIRYGRPGANEKLMINAAKAAHAHDFILKSKDGYETMVGERGMQLSGGERQRISLARAFIKNAPVLILDEPTSSLDIKTEAQIIDAIERLMEGKTTFMITHRLDTLSSCNVILHLENGKIVEVVRDRDINYFANKKIAYLSQLQ
ncbi:MAG: ABC transporter ATP-binding protein [Saprospiraceae bacterium]